MSNIDKTVHSEENIINDPAPAPAVANPVAECEMDALLLGRIGVSSIYFSTYKLGKKVEEWYMNLKCKASCLSHDMAVVKGKLIFMLKRNIIKLYCWV